MKRLATGVAVTILLMLILFSAHAQSQTQQKNEKESITPQTIIAPEPNFAAKKPPEAPKPVEPEPIVVPAPKVAVMPPETPKTAYSGSLSEWLRILRVCESGGNYQINTGNGYFGAYQFSAPTWNHWNTGYARADLAPPDVQDATIIKNTNAASGGLATQNPGCYHKHGLSAFPPTG